MDKQKNNKFSDLESLLRNASNSEHELDAFEKEALEGFMSLSSNDEAVLAKRELDKRISPLFETKKTKIIPMYWAAAAGVAVIITLVGIFKFSGTLETAEMADKNSKIETVKQDDIADMSPASEVATGNATKANEESPGKKLEEKSKMQESEPFDVLDDRKSNSPPSDNNQEKTISDLEGEVNSASDESDADLAFAEDADKKPAEKENIPTAPKTIPKQDAYKSGAGGEAGKDSPGGNNNNAKKRSESSKNEDGVNSRMILKKSKSKSTGKTESAAPSVAEEQKEVKQEGPTTKSNLPAVELNIGERTLHGLIDDFMKENLMKFEFTSVLTISAKNKVEKVQFTEFGTATKKQLRTLEKYLKKQDCFVNSSGGPASYKLEFKKN